MCPNHNTVPCPDTCICWFRFNAEDNASPLYFTEAAEKSHFFSSLSKKVRKTLQEKPFAMENHSNGMMQDHFNAYVPQHTVNPTFRFSVPYAVMTTSIGGV